MVIWGGMAAGALSGGGGGIGDMIGGIIGGGGGGAQATEPTALAPRQTPHFGTMMLQAFLGGVPGVGGKRNTLAAGSLDMQLQSGMITEGEYYKLKSLGHEAKYKNELWTKNAAYEDWLKGTDVGGGVRARPVGLGPSPLNDAEKTYLKIPTSWQVNASKQIAAIMDPKSGLSEPEQIQALHDSDDLTRQWAGLRVYSMEERRQQEVGNLRWGWAEGTLNPKQEEMYKKLTAKPLTAHDQMTKDEVDTWSHWNVNWLKYLDTNNVIESDLTKEELKHHRLKAFGGDYGAAVMFDHYNGKYGEKFTARSTEKKRDQFQLAVLRFLPQIDEHPTLSPEQKITLKQKIGRARSYPALKNITGPNGEPLGDIAYDGVKVVENEIFLANAEMADEKLRLDRGTARLRYDDARQDWLARVSPEEQRKIDLDIKVAEEQREIQARKDVATFLADLKAQYAGGELAGITPATGSTIVNKISELLIADSRAKDDGAPAVITDPEDVEMMYDILMKVFSDYQEKMNAAENKE